jgi:hypothetical protein
MTISSTSAQSVERTQAQVSADTVAPVPANLAKRLEPDERLLWWGRPDASQFAGQYALSGVTFLVLMVVGMAVLTSAFLHDRGFTPTDPLATKVHWVLLLACGIGGFIGSFVALRAMRSRHDVAYGLTDRRLIIVIGTWKTKSFGPEAFARIKRGRTDHRTIWFDYGSDGEGYGYRHALLGIADADHVEQLLRQQFPPVKKKSAWSFLS